MRSVFLSILFCLIAQAVLAMGAWGTYTITGIMLDKKINKPIANAIFIIQNDTIMSDAEGRFSYKMSWETACPSGQSRAKTLRQTRRINPKKVSFKYTHSHQSIKNEWQKRRQEEREAKTPPFFVTLYW